LKQRTGFIAVAWREKRQVKATGLGHIVFEASLEHAGRNFQKELKRRLPLGAGLMLWMQVKSSLRSIKSLKFSYGHKWIMISFRT
jgi:hypothetical protein